MTTFIPTDGAQVETLIAPDAAILITCPGCGHLTPHVPAASLIVDPATAVAPWIDCACQHGAGLSRFNLPFTGCECLLRFRVEPTGAGNRYRVAGVDHQTMAMHRRMRELATELERADASPSKPKRVRKHKPKRVTKTASRLTA